MTRTLAVLALVLPSALGAATMKFPGQATSVAVERASGRIAVCRDGRIEVWAGIDAPRPETTFEVPNLSARLLEFHGETILYSFAHPGYEGAQFFAVAPDGLERVPWPNDGIGATFPSATSRLTLDGRGVYDVLALDAAVRADLGVPLDVEDGATVVPTYRFADERVLVRFSADFAGALALSPEDLLVALRPGGLLRYKSPAGVLWKDDVPGPTWRLLDALPSIGLALARDGRGALVAVELEGGGVHWERDLGGLTLADALLLGDGRALALLGGGRLMLVSAAGGPPVPLGDTAEDRAVVEAWAKGREEISAVWEVAGAAGPQLLIQMPEGVVLLPLPAATGRD